MTDIQFQHSSTTEKVKNKTISQTITCLIEWYSRNNQFNNNHYLIQMLWMLKRRTHLSLDSLTYIK